MKVIGLDIGSRFIKIVHARRGKKLRVKNVYMLETPEGAVSDGEILDLMLLASRIRTFLRDKKLKAREISISIQSSNLMIRELKLPALKKAEIMPAIEFELSQTFPGIVQTHTISYQQQSKMSEPMEGISVFCPNKILDGYVSLANQLGMPLRYIDAGANSVAKAFKAFGDQKYANESVMIVDIGMTGSQVTVMSKGKIFLSRHVETGALSVDQIVSSRLGINIQQAERARSNNKFGMYGLQESDLQMIARIGYSSVEEQIRQTIDYFAYNKSKEPIKKIYLAGGGCNFPGLDKYLRDVFSVPVERMNAAIVGVKDEAKPDSLLAAVGVLLDDNSLTADIDLTPGLQIIAKAKSRTNRLALVMGLVTLIAGTGVGAYLYLDNSIEAKQAFNNKLNKDMAEYSTVNKLKEEINNNKKTVDALKAILEKAESTSLVNTQMLESIGSVMPEGLFISTYSTENGTSLVLSGISRERSYIAEFLYSVKRIEGVSTAELKNVSARLGTDGMPTDYSFSMSLRLKGRYTR